MNNNASMEEVLRAEVECLRNQLAEKDKEIKQLNKIIDGYYKEVEYLEAKINKLEEYR